MEIINDDLQLAFDFVKYTNRNIFLTGKAGTGKTTFLHNLKKTSLKRMIVVAPTGVAAINAGGVTIHSFFQLPFHPYIPVLYLPDAKAARDEQAETSYKMSREKANIIRSIDLLVIDEISMVRADTLDAIDFALRRYKNRQLPFGGVQMLMIGDLQQLAPVVKDDDNVLLNKYYDSPFFFGSRALQSTDYVTIELKHIYRQNDRTFIELLNKIRTNKVDNEVLSELNKRYVPDFDTDSNGGYITLSTHNAQAQTLNDTKLKKLQGTEHRFVAVTKDEFPDFSFPAPSELILKKGAQVMFLKNDLSGRKLYFNGKIGKVEGFDDEIIIVKCPGDEEPILVEPVEWQNMKYTLDESTKEISEDVIGTFTQYPLRLAWAITIHKSQGLTFDRAVIDANAAFAHGQVYVALSRCRTLEGLVLSSKISTRSIIDDRSISDFTSACEQKIPTRERLNEYKREYQKMLLKELFDFGAIVRSISYCLKIANEHKTILLGSPGGLLEDALSLVTNDLVEVSSKFNLQLDLYLKGNTDVEENSPLQDRLQKAGDYFSGKLSNIIKEKLNNFSVETDNKTVRKALNDSFDRILKETGTKLACLSSVKTGFTISKYLEAKSKASVESPAPSKASKASRLKTETTGVVGHPALLRAIKEWRNEKAAKLDLPNYMVLPQKTIVALAEVMPQNIHSLSLVKGMGKKKSESFGEELLDIIVSYCHNKNIVPPEPQPLKMKKAKKAKEDTKKKSFDLFKLGRTVAQIAEERSLIDSTIENHLAHYVGTGDLAIEEFVPKEKTEMIMKHFDSDDELRLGPVKEALGDKVSWSELRFVANHLLLLRKKGLSK